jgi:hypothetical protein
MLVASDFLDECRLLLDDSTATNFKSRYTDPELFAYLQGAYKKLQTDAPQFIATKKIATQEDTKEYYINDNLLDGIKLLIGEDEFVKTSLRKIMDLQDIYDNYYATNGDEILLNNFVKGGETLTFTYYKIKDLVSDDSEIAIPLYYHEALRLLFLSRTLEKQPSKNDRDLATHYYKLYMGELMQVKRNTRQKYRGLTSSHQKI